jgi:hypothetical protein
VTAAGRAPRRLWPAAAVVIIVLGAGLALAVTSGRGAGNPGPGRRSPAPPAGPGTSGPQLPRTDLAGLRWSGYHGVQLPSSPEAGPHHTANGLAWGFADTPLGALLAALDIAVRANAQWGPGIFVPTIGDQVTGPGAAALLASCQADYGQASQDAHIIAGQPLGNAYVTEVAFRWVGWTPADAAVDLVSAGPDSQGVTIRASTRVEVRWQGGDWRVVAPPGGDWGNAATRLTSLAGYSIFPGQG